MTLDVHGGLRPGLGRLGPSTRGAAEQPGAMRPVTWLEPPGAATPRTLADRVPCTPAGCGAKARRVVGPVVAQGAGARRLLRRGRAVAATSRRSSAAGRRCADGPVRPGCARGPPQPWRAAGRPGRQFVGLGGALAVTSAAAVWRRRGELLVGHGAGRGRGRARWRWASARLRGRRCWPATCTPRSSGRPGLTAGPGQ